MTNAYLNSWQHTLKEVITFFGIGLHSGRRVMLRIEPAEPDSGRVFVRSDVPAGEAEIPALWTHSVNTELCTELQNVHGVCVATVEHLLAALYASGIDNARIVVNGPEIPILDGSAFPYMSLIRSIGTRQQDRPRRAIQITQPVAVYERERSIALMPASVPRITLDIDFASRAVGKQSLSMTLDDTSIAREIVAARTFGFAKDVDRLRARGLARGGSLANAVLFDDERPLNEDGLRFPDEPVRHKILDAIGDLALAGAPVIGHLHGRQSGHVMNTRILRELFRRRDSWRYLDLSEVRDRPMADSADTEVSSSSRENS
jgi:UDP-3-O-[3-hydroxymyristoyl] N-acetylglucosamine deacetylase